MIYLMIGDVPKYIKYCQDLESGRSTQYSNVSCPKGVYSSKIKAGKASKSQQDSIRFYPLCASCLEKVETVGGPLPNEDILFII